MTGRASMGGKIGAVLRREGVTLAIVAAGWAIALLAPFSPLVALAATLIALILWFLLRPGDAPDPPSAAPDAVASVPFETELGSQISARDLAAAVPYPLVVFEASSAIAYVNDAAQRAFGPLQEGMSLLLKFRAPEMQDLINAVTAGAPGPVTAEYTERFPIEATYAVTGGPIGTQGSLFFLLFKDQSESRRIDRMRADFIANASHELRTPLASISGFLETLRGPARNDPAARERFLAIMQEQTQRMSRLIDDLLSLSRLETKPHGRPAGTVNLPQLVESVIDTLAPLASELNVQVEKDFPKEPLSVRGDRDELFQVFANLVENACKYGQSGGHIRVAIGTTAGDIPEAWVAVQDFGPGIAEEHIPRITERFYRADVQSNHPQKGTGLGLAIVKHILTRHDGRLAVSSVLGQGATFTAYLPLN